MKTFTEFLGEEHEFFKQSNKTQSLKERAGEKMKNLLQEEALLIRERLEEIGIEVTSERIQPKFSYKKAISLQLYFTIDGVDMMLYDGIDENRFIVYQVDKNLKENDKDYKKMVAAHPYLEDIIKELKEYANKSLLICFGSGEEAPEDDYVTFKINVEDDEDIFSFGQRINDEIFRKMKPEHRIFLTEPFVLEGEEFYMGGERNDTTSFISVDKDIEVFVINNLSGKIIKKNW